MASRREIADAPIRAYGIEMRSLTAGDLERVREWRNHPEVARYMLDQTRITPEDHRLWFERVARDPARAYFVIGYRGEPIGLAYLTAVDAPALAGAETIEVGFYLGPNRYRGTVVAFFPALALNDYCFERLGCRSLKAVVKHDNSAALRFNETLGYVAERESQGLVTIRLDYDAYRAAREKLRRFARD